jgi:hypothetical protein
VSDLIVRGWQGRLHPTREQGRRPAHAVLDTVAQRDGALRRMMAEQKAGRKCGFPKAKKKFANESSIYCVGQASRISEREAVAAEDWAPATELRQGHLLAAPVWRDGNHWMISAQVECARPVALPERNVVAGIDLGV